MQNFSQQLLEAYDKECRKELSISLAQAYLHSHMKAKEFGSFWAQAQSYLRWFYADALLEMLLNVWGWILKLVAILLKTVNILRFTRTTGK